MKIYQFEKATDIKPVRALMREYLIWTRDNIRDEYGIDYSDEIMDMVIDNDIQSIEKFLPPLGCLFLAEADLELTGMVCLKRLDEGLAEIKRMYVRPQFRSLGLARQLVQNLINEAKNNNYSLIRLESSHFMKMAHPLYRSFGFQEIDDYEGSESTPELKEHTIFMELSLTNS